MLAALLLRHRGPPAPHPGGGGLPDGLRRWHPRVVEIHERFAPDESPGERLRRIVDTASIELGRPVPAAQRDTAVVALSTFVANESASHVGPRVVSDDLDLILIAIAVLEVL